MGSKWNNLYELYMNDFQININFRSHKNRALSTFILQVNLILFVEDSIGATYFILILLHLVSQSNMYNSVQWVFPNQPLGVVSLGVLQNDNGGSLKCKDRTTT